MATATKNDTPAQTAEPSGATGPARVIEVMTVIERVAAIVAEMPAIGKSQRNEQQKFMYRGHDDVMNALNPLLSKYRVFFVPQVIERVTAHRQTSKGGILYEVDLHVKYTFYGPQGDTLVATAWGEGTDSGDKSTNKAMTMALKNVLAQVFAVSTEEHASYDTDRHSDEPTEGRRPTTSDGITLLVGAPLGWTQIMAHLKLIDAGMPWKEWVAQAAVALTGKASFTDLDEQEKIDCGIKVANGVLHLLGILDGREFPPPTRAEIQTAFSFADSVDVKLDGPEISLDPTEAAAKASGSAESATSDTPAPDAPVDPEAPEDAGDAPLGPMPEHAESDIGFGEAPA